MKRSDRGAVLVLVLGAVVLLTIVAVELASRASADSVLAKRAEKDAAFRRLFTSGSEIARGLLLEPDVRSYDWLGDRWNQHVRFDLDEGESAELRVADECGKINIARVFSHPDEKGGIGEMVERLFVFLAEDRSKSGAEWTEMKDRVLERLGFLVGEGGGKPAIQTPLLTLDGLREAGLTREEVFGEYGLHRYLTCFGEGKININTAPPAVLFSLHDEIDVELAYKIAAHRGDPEGEPGSYEAFEEGENLRDVDGATKEDFVDGKPKVVWSLLWKIAGRVVTRSTCFSARVDAEVEGRRRQSWAFFEADVDKREDGTLVRKIKKLVFEEILP